MPRQLIVNFGHRPLLTFNFAIEQSPIAQLWLERMEHRSAWPMDDHERFYGFDSFEQERCRALETMKRSIHTINQHRYIIERSLDDIDDQDTLNYLHNIFERFHGQLDQQQHEFWQTAPDSVKKALSDINITVHRCESLRSRKLLPRFVCTWYGMPKTKILSWDLQRLYGVGGSEFGGVYLNYAEIGKTAKDMAYDNDMYMADDMFQPFSHYSADFRVDFYDETPEEIAYRNDKTTRYFQQNQDFFRKFGITSADDIRIRPLKFKVAQLIYDSKEKDYIISQIANNQYVSSVTLK